MSEPVLIRVHSSLMPVSSGEASLPEEFRFEARGFLRLVSGVRHILYEEAADEAGAVTKTHLILRDLCVEIRRSGSTESAFCFRENEVTEALYRTPYGSIPMQIRTRRLSVRDFGQEIRVEIGYDILSGEQTVSRAEITVAAGPAASASRQ